MMARQTKAKRRLGRPPKGERGDTRQELLDEALRLFAEKGYAGTSIREIAEGVGVRDSAIYSHFSSKRELLDSLIDESGPHLLNRLGLDFDRLSERPPSEALPEFLERLLQAWDEERPRMLISMLTREGLTGVHEALEAVQKRLMPHFRRWASEGSLRDDVPPKFLLSELLLPLTAIRLFYLHAQASSAQRKQGRELAREHVTHFVATSVRES